MFSTSEKIEISAVNGFNSFRTCLIALVEYAIVSIFLLFFVKFGVSSHY